MQQFQHPGTIQLIHEARVQQEIERSSGLTLPTGQRPSRTGRPGDGIRREIGRLLVGIGVRIDPGQRRRHPSPEAGAAS